MKLSPLVIFALDAAIPELLMKWAGEGKLPNLKKLLSRGIHGYVEGKEMICEQGVWPQIFTGIPRDQLKYFFFRQPIDNSYDVKTIEAIDLGVKPFWEKCIKENKRVAIIDPLDPMPVEGLKGIQVFNWGMPYVYEPLLVIPKEEEKRVIAAAGKGHIIYEILRSSQEQDQKMFEQLKNRLKKKEQLMLELLKEPYDLVVAGFGEMHTGGHQFWRYRPGGREEKKDPELRGAIETLYKETDAAIGRIIAQLPEDSNIIAIGSLGLRDQYPTDGLINDFCFKLGYQARPKPAGLASGGVMGIVRKILPEAIRVELSKWLLSRNQREKIYSEQWKNSIDWSKTYVYALPSMYKSFIKVNLKGREPMGIVPPEEYDQWLDRITEDLYALTDAATGKPLVERVTRSKGLFSDKIPDAFPDLFVNWHVCDHFVPAANHPKVVLKQKEPEFFRDSEHDEKGLFVAAGPAFSHSPDPTTISVLDFVPGFLELLELKKDETLHGQSFLDKVQKMPC